MKDRYITCPVCKAEYSMFDSLEEYNRVLRHQNPPIGQQVFNRLILVGIECSWEYPGYICVPLSDGTSAWNFGTVNETWQGDLWESEAGVAVDHWVSEIPSDSQDVDKIFRTIHGFLMHWDNNHPDARTEKHETPGS